MISSFSPGHRRRTLRIKIVQTEAEDRKMTAIDLFRKIEASERSMSTATRKVEVLKSVAERITGSLEGEVVSHTRNVHSFEDSVLRLQEAKDELKQVADYYSRLFDFITEKMTHLEEPDDEELLTYHYLSHFSLAVVAEKMHRCRAWTYRRHDVALKNLDLILKDVNEGDLPSIA